MNKEKLPPIILSVLIATSALLIVAVGLLAYLINAQEQQPIIEPSPPVIVEPTDPPTANTPSPDEVFLNISEAEDSNISPDGVEIEFVDGEIIYKNAGSGSCPPVLESAVYYPRTSEIILFQKDYKNQMCTADYRPIQQIVSLGNGEQLPSYAQIVLI